MAFLRSPAAHDLTDLNCLCYFLFWEHLQNINDKYFKWRQLIFVEYIEDILGKLKNNQLIEHSCQFIKTNYLMTNVFN